MMSPENRKRIQEAVALVGDELKTYLPPHVNHPGGRNSYAHVWHTIKEHFGRSYKELDDSQVEEIMAIVQRVKLNSR